MKVLLAEDDVMLGRSMERGLRMAGFSVDWAHDGLQTQAALREQEYEVVLLDIGLPKLNGYEVAERMRQQPWGEHITLVALTGWGQEEDRRKSAQAGFDAHLVKPVDLVDLDALMQAAV